MKQKFTFKLLLVVMLMAFCGNGAWAQSVWEKVTSATQLEVGSNYIIVNEANSKGMGVKNSNNRGQVIIDIIGNEITCADANLAVLTLGGAEGQWTFFSAADNGYLCAGSSSKNYLKIQQTLDANGKATIAFTQDNADIKFTGTYKRNIIRYNSASSLFSCYGSGQMDVQLYKEKASAPVDPTKKDRNLSFGEKTSFDIVEGTVFQQPTLSGAVTGVTYTSSVPTVATVDKNTGDVQIKGVGTTIITASAPTDDTYNADEVFYTLTVNAKAKYVANIAEFLTKADTQTEYTFKNPVVVVKQHNDDLWVKDATGSICVNGAVDQTYNMGDQIPAGFSGTYNVDTHKVINLSTPKNFSAPEVTGVVVEPVEKAVNGITMADLNTYVVVKNVTVASDKKSISDGINTFATYEKFGTATYPTDQARYDVIGIVNYYNNLQLLPMEIVLHKDENLKDQTLSFPSDKYVTTYGGVFAAPTLTGAMTTVTYSSSYPSVATVDAASGAIVVKGIGTTTITASAAAENGYNGGVAFYELVVEKYSEPFLTETNDVNQIFTNEGLARGEAVSTLNWGGLTITATDANNYDGIRVYTGGNISIKSNNGIPLKKVVLVTNKKDYTGVSCSIDGVATDVVEDIAGNAPVVLTWEGSTTSAVTFKPTNRLNIISVEVEYEAYALNISAAGYATFAARKPYTMPKSLQGGIVSVKGQNAEVVYMYDANTVVPADEALLIKGAQGSYVLPLSAEAGTRFEENQLKGAFTNAEIKAAEGNEIFIFAQGTQGLGFYWQKGRTDGGAVSGIENKAYLELPKAAGVNGLRLVEGEATGIEGVESANEKAVIYNLAGVRVNADKNNLPKGLYIINGKKVLVK